MVILICIFLMISDFEQLFMCLLASHLYVFFGEMSIQVLCPFFKWIFKKLNCTTSLYTLDNNPLSDPPFTNMFSCLVGCLFVLLMVSFAVQKLSTLM